MLDIAVTVIAFLIFTILVMSAIIAVCIYIAIRRGEDIESDKVRDKYTEVAASGSLLIVVTTYILYKLQ